MKYIGWAVFAFFTVSFVTWHIMSQRPMPRRTNFKVVAPIVSGPGKKLDGKFLFRGRPADPEMYWLEAPVQAARPSKADWERAKTVLRDIGPATPADHFAFPKAGQPLLLDGRTIVPRGRRWAHILFSTDGAYVALFTQNDLPIPPAGKPPGIWSSFLFAEKWYHVGDFFVDVYRRRDGALVASLSEPVERTYWNHDHSEDWPRTAMWVDDTTFFVQTRNAVSMAALPRLEPIPLPFKNCQTLCGSGLSLSTFERPWLRVHSLRAEPVDRDGNGLIESLLAHLTVEPEIPGDYSLTPAFEEHEIKGRLLDLRPGRQEVTFELLARDLKKAKGKLHLTHLTYNLNVDEGKGERHPLQGQADLPPLTTAVYPKPRLEPRLAYLVPGTANTRRVEPKYFWGPYFEIDVKLFSRDAAECRLYASLTSETGSIAPLEASGKLTPGFNTIHLHIASHKKTYPVFAGPHKVSDASLDCNSPETSTLLGDFAIPTVDFSGIPGARCWLDENGDGRVDEADAAIVWTSISGTPPKNPSKHLKEEIEAARVAFKASFIAGTTKDAFCRTLASPASKR
jgi:hypothetical protein